MFDKTIENIKNTQTLCFIVIVMISLFLISYLACQQNFKKKNKKLPPSPIRKKKGRSTIFFYVAEVVIHEVWAFRQYCLPKVSSDFNVMLYYTNITWFEGD